MLGTQEIPLRSISNADSRQALATPKYLSSGDTGQFADHQTNSAESGTASAPGIIRVRSLAVAAASTSDDIISKGVPRILADADGGPRQSDGGPRPQQRRASCSLMRDPAACAAFVNQVRQAGSRVDQVR